MTELFALPENAVRNGNDEIKPFDQKLHGMRADRYKRRTAQSLDLEIKRVPGHYH
ncbi:MAG: hypothetical protein WD002_15885 [Pseudomonadales bacterium]